MGGQACAVKFTKEDETGMPKLLVHPGSPKTATSAIQYVLSKNCAYLNRNGINVLNIDAFRNSELLVDFMNFYRNDCATVSRDRILAFFEPHRDCDYLLVSEETFCHDFMPSKKFGHGGIDRAARSAEYLSLWPFDDIHVVLTIRNQRSLLLSTYTHFVHRNREHRTFETWLQSEIDVNRLSWLDAIDAFFKVFGRDAVTVLPYEICSSQGIDTYVSEFFGAFDIEDKNLAQLDCTVSDVKNPSPSNKAVKLSRLLNPHIVQPGRSQAVNTYLLNMFTSTEFGKFMPANQDLLQLPDHIQQQNETLATSLFSKWSTEFLGKS